MASRELLSVNERVLLHLSRFARALQDEPYPPEVTQGGIADGIAISRTHVPRAVRGLLEDGFVEERRAHVQGHPKRIRAYALTPTGMARAEELAAELRGKPLEVRIAGQLHTLSLNDLELRTGRKIPLAPLLRLTELPFDLEALGRAPVRDLADAPVPEPFYDREKELWVLREWAEGHRPLLVLFGNHGFGTTALARKFVTTLERENVLWLNLAPQSTAAMLQQRLRSFATSLGLDAAVSPLNPLRDAEAFLILNDWFEVGEEVVELAAQLLTEPGRLKILVTMREETPPYHRFYQKPAGKASPAEEIHLKGLDREAARRLLGNERIDDASFELVYIMTRGQPLVLKLLRDGDQAGLRSATTYTNEELRFLIYLRDKGR